MQASYLTRNMKSKSIDHVDMPYLLFEKKNIIVSIQYVEKEFLNLFFVMLSLQLLDIREYIHYVLKRLYVILVQHWRPGRKVVQNCNTASMLALYRNLLSL
jgi:hypothetical protein